MAIPGTMRRLKEKAHKIIILRRKGILHLPDHILHHKEILHLHVHIRHHSGIQIRRQIVETGLVEMVPEEAEDRSN